MTVEPALFRGAMARLGAAVNVITTDGPAGRHGMTASAVCSVSDEPPTLLLCVNAKAAANRLIKANMMLCVNILSAQQEGVSRAFGDSALDVDSRFANHGSWRRLENGCWGLDAALAVFGCRVSSIAEVGSHSVFFAQVEEISVGADLSGLMYFNRDYHHLPARADAMQASA